jgi:hypothetical protein
MAGGKGGRPRIHATREDAVAAHRDTTIAWRDIRRLRGLCPQCGSQWKGPQWECLRCRTRNNEQRRQRRRQYATDSSSHHCRVGTRDSG